MAAHPTRLIVPPIATTKITYVAIATIVCDTPSPMRHCLANPRNGSLGYFPSNRHCVCQHGLPVAHSLMLGSTTVGPLQGVRVCDARYFIGCPLLGAGSLGRQCCAVY